MSGVLHSLFTCLIYVIGVLPLTTKTKAKAMVKRRTGTLFARWRNFNCLSCVRKESDAREFLIIILSPELRLEADQEWRTNFLIERDTNKSCKGHMKRLSSI